MASICLGLNMAYRIFADYLHTLHRNFWIILGQDNFILLCESWFSDYHQTSNISRILVSNKIVDHPDVFGTSPVGAAPIASSFST